MDMGVEKLQEFLLWCLLLNIGIYTFTVLATVLMRDFMSGMHEKLFGLREDTVHKAFYTYLAAYKLLIIVFNFVPWLALVIIE